jgi:hypothetical protein
MLLDKCDVPTANGLVVVACCFLSHHPDLHLGPSQMFIFICEYQISYHIDKQKESS